MLHMEFLIKEILKKHDIKDEKLAMALADIFDVFYKESQRQEVSELKMKALMKGIKF